jgi:hypothetical protein
MNTWFRMYAEFSHDPKVQAMPEIMQRRLLMIFCLRCEDSLKGLSDSDIAFHLRISDEEWTVTKRLFIEKKFISVTRRDGANVTANVTVTNWSVRQYISDSSKERTRKYRERIVTSQERHGDTLEQNRTDTEQNRTETKLSLVSKDEPEERTRKPTKQPSRIEQEFEEDYPKFWAHLGGRKAIFKSYEKARKEVSREVLMSEVVKQGPRLLAEAARRDGSPVYPTTWLNQGRWTDKENVQPSLGFTKLPPAKSLDQEFLR